MISPESLRVLRPSVVSPLKLGFAVKVLGKPDLKSNDARRWQSNPHLRVSIGYLREIFAYLDEIDVRMYRMSSDIAPYATHPTMPQFHGQIRECATSCETSASSPATCDCGCRSTPRSS